MAPVAQAVKHLHSRLQRGCRGAAVFHYQEVLRRGTVEVTRSGSSQIAAAARTIEAVAALGMEMKRRRTVLQAAGAALRGHASSSALATATLARAESPLVTGGSLQQQRRPSSASLRQTEGWRTWRQSALTSWMRACWRAKTMMKTRKVMRSNHGRRRRQGGGAKQESLHRC